MTDFKVGDLIQDTKYGPRYLLGDSGFMLFDDGTVTYVPYSGTINSVGWFRKTHFYKLVVLDPKSEDDALRLMKAADAATLKIPYENDGSYENLYIAPGKKVLKELAEPVPPRIPEPMSLGALVEELDGHLYVRADFGPPAPWLRLNDSAARIYRYFKDIESPTLVFEGKPLKPAPETPEELKAPQRQRGCFE